MIGRSQLWVSQKGMAFDMHGPSRLHAGTVGKIIGCSSAPLVRQQQPMMDVATMVAFQHQHQHYGQRFESLRGSPRGIVVTPSGGIDF